MSHTAIIALGSNLGDRVMHLRTAVSKLQPIVAQSNVFETAPIGGPDNQGPYLNMVCVITTDLEPAQLLQRLNQIEAEADRERLVRWDPRTLDLDIVFYDDIVMNTEILTIPHPRYSVRRFVLAPLSQVAPERCPRDWNTVLPPDEVHDRGPLGSL